ncbi:fatty acid desaturase [Photobacterium sp. 1_MG-2023]|uniref:fatty acid desaturase family protein n=1 Tax=Photobacterium sp. 1_MG-2023 TaxID=3062646 RepID=UPI0026E1414F|nr:fatty acid desaturase [Photobacterium sp. 1_MG-2023]MDO6705113.1 fatty acid desaturase [Photobacterium sp. 1_MG-2023]
MIHVNIPPIDSEEPQHSAGIRVGKDLLKATKNFTEESPATSWWYVISTFLFMMAALAVAGIVEFWPIRFIFSVLGGLLIVRSFITYHDYLHGSILHHSRIAFWLFYTFGALVLTPPRSWLESHNYHHGHVGQISTIVAGTFPVISTKMWKESSRWQRLVYRIQRHPLVVLFSYPLVFLINITLIPLLKNPIKHFDSLISLIVHFGLITLLWLSGGFNLAFFVILLPMTIASTLGCYLFFAQHSFRRMQIVSPESWNYYRAALESSSYMRMNRIMQWFTGNIGYHHIHHLNVRIPFYRLPEVMDKVPELQAPITTTLSPSDIINCFRSALWDEDKQRMVSYKEAREIEEDKYL